MSSVSAAGDQLPRRWNKSLESRDARKPARPVRTGGRRKRTCTLQAPRRRPTGTVWDDDFGPFFLKFGTYFPYTAKLCLNGNEWAKRQAAKAGIGFEALDNGFAAVDDVAALQRICDSLGPAQIDALLRKWLAIAGRRGGADAGAGDADPRRGDRCAGGQSAVRAGAAV
jgi:hypothetical protein